MPRPDLIYVLGKQVKLFQPDGGFRTSLDTVMLAAACPVKGRETVLDLGCGVGGAGFCILHRMPEVRLTGIDIQSECIELAVRNAGENLMSDRTDFLCGDVRDFNSDERFDHVICNPPYLEAGAHLRSPAQSKAIANGHGEADLRLRDWIDAAFRNLKSKGSLTIIHRADAVDRIIHGMGRRFGSIEIIPLWPRAGEPAKRVIVRALKDRRSPAVISAGIILHETGGEYTAEAERILRDGKPIF